MAYKKRIPLALIVFALVVAVAMPVFVSAQTETAARPGSFFYFVDTTFEKVGLFFIFNPEKKARKALEYADKRLAEIESIDEKEKPDVVKSLIANYENNIALAVEKSKEVTDKEKAESLFISIAENTSKNQEVLSAVLIKVPEEAKEAIMQAIEASKKSNEEAMKQISELKGEIEQLKQEVAELKEAEKERQVTEVEKLKKEIDGLKKQRPPSVTMQKSIEPTKKEVVNTQPEQILGITAKKEENFREVAITTYKQTAEFFKRAIEETRNDYIPDIKNRRDKLVYRISLIRKDPFTNSGDGAVLNEMFDLFAQEHEREVKFIDEILAYIESNLASMSRYQAEYDRNASLLLADNKKFVTRAEITSIIQHDIDFIDTKYQGVKNINNAMINYHQSVINKEDSYAEEYIIIKNALLKLSEPTKVSAPIYQPMPPIDFGLTARQELLLNPIQCTITHDPFQSHVTCY
ncbi:MAG: DUF5667 domain-containing protein [bacterium]|nr:DUF5667 domain-containing protein [bacterium]